MKRLIYLILILIVYCHTNLFSQESDSLNNIRDSLKIISISDSTSEYIDSSLSKSDTVSVYNDTTSVFNLKDEETDKKNEKIRIVRRNFSYRTQVGSAVFIMSMFAIILFTVQSMNPN